MRSGVESVTYSMEYKMKCCEIRNVRHAIGIVLAELFWYFYIDALQ